MTARRARLGFVLVVSDRGSCGYDCRRRMPEHRASKVIARSVRGRVWRCRAGIDRGAAAGAVGGSLRGLSRVCDSRRFGGNHRKFTWRIRPNCSKVSCCADDACVLYRPHARSNFHEGRFTLVDQSEERFTTLDIAQPETEVTVRPETSVTVL